MSKNSSEHELKPSIKSNSFSFRAKYGQIRIKTTRREAEDFLNDVVNGIFTNLTNKELERALNNVDAVDIFNILQDITIELASVKTDNHVLIEFLQQNDPKLLIGLGQRMEAEESKLNSSKRSSDSPRTILSRSAGSKRSLSAISMMNKTKTGVEFRLNYRAKTDMAEKTILDTELRIRELKQRVMRDTKYLNAKNEELNLRIAEAQETMRNFEMHFLREIHDINFLEKATEKQVDRKLRKFVTNWVKQARVLLATLRLMVHTVQEKCRQHRGELVRKADLYGILGPVDFEQLTIERDELLGALEEQNTQAAAFKGVAGKAANALFAEKETMLALEGEGRRLQSKSADAAKIIAKLEKEVQLVEYSNNRDMNTLSKLKEQLERYEAPSVGQYIEKKDELLVLEKEEKMLLRKVHIQNMKLTNIMKQHKK